MTDEERQKVFANFNRWTKEQPASTTEGRIEMTKKSLVTWNDRDELPESGRTVLISHAFLGVIVGYYDDKNDSWYQDSVHALIRHAEVWDWANLPAPPEGI